MSVLPVVTFLSVVDECDNYRPSQGPTLVPFFLALGRHGEPPQDLIGLLLPEIVTLFAQDASQCFVVSTSPAAVAFSASCSTPADRSAAMLKLVTGWRDGGRFADVVGGRLWRAEDYAVYANPFVRTEPAFVLERSACALFGIVTYGVHLTVYTHDFKVWVPRRSQTKQTWPGHLDNTVAGGICAGMSPLEVIVKEAEEEANLDKSLVLSLIRPVGLVSYFYRTSKGWLQPEVEYVYELQLPADSTVVPRPNDDEVESFSLYTLDEIKAPMLNAEFKPNCAIVLLDFLIRHGFVTAENEPNLLEIVSRMHGRFEWYLMRQPAIL